MRTSGAVREFTGSDVPDSVIAEVPDDARFAPSGANRPPRRVIVVRDAATRAALAGLYREGWRDAFDGPALDVAQTLPGAG